MVQSLTPKHTNLDLNHLFSNDALICNNMLLHGNQPLAQLQTHARTLTYSEDIMDSAFISVLAKQY